MYFFFGIVIYFLWEWLVFSYKIILFFKKYYYKYFIVRYRDVWLSVYDGFGVLGCVFV